MKTDWNKSLEPLYKEYGTRPHPLEYENRYQLMVMVILSAQTSDKMINSLSKNLFQAYPSLEFLSTATPEQIQPHIKSVRGFIKKSHWISEISKTIKKDDNIPTTMEELVKLPGISRKSANVIIRESGGKAEGIIVDLHVVRVAPRLGIAEGDNPAKIEKQLMEIIPQKHWNEAGMAISFLGREVCRPTDPQHNICVMRSACQYYKSLKKGTRT